MIPGPLRRPNLKFSLFSAKSAFLNLKKDEYSDYYMYDEFREGWNDLSGVSRHRAYSVCDVTDRHSFTDF